VSSPKGLHRLIRQELPLCDLERARLPLTVIATNLLDGSEVHLERGAAEPALLASTAIPGVFPPACHERRWLVDGGIASNTPIAAAVAQHAERILVLPTGMSCALQTPPRGVIGEALLAGQWTLRLAIKIALNVLTPFVVANLGLLSRQEHY